MHNLKLRKHIVTRRIQDNKQFGSRLKLKSEEQKHQAQMRKMQIRSKFLFKSNNQLQLHYDIHFREIHSYSIEYSYPLLFDLQMFLKLVYFRNVHTLS